MAFRDILKQNRQQGSGLISSMATAAAASAREKLDIRNPLFKSGSLMNAIFPNVKGYQYKEKTSKLKTSPELNLSSDKLDTIAQSTSIAAKNSIVLPSMARDMFLVKQNIIKMVKLQGGKPTTKSGDWFARQAARENQYESQFAKKSTSPTAKALPEQKSFLDSILGFFKGGFLSLLVKGGLLYFIGKYFTSEEFKTEVNKITDVLFKTLFGEDYKVKLKSIIEDVISNVSLAFLGYIAMIKLVEFAMAGLKTGLIALELGMLKAVSAIGAVGAGGLIGAIGALVAFAYWLIKNDSRQKTAPDEFGNVQGGMTPDMSSAISYGETASSTDAEVRQARENMRKSDDPAVRAAALELDKNDAKKALSSPTQTPPSTSPTPTSTAPTTSSAVTFKSLSVEQQNALLDKQFEKEGNKPGNLAYDLNNPGAMQFKPWMEKYGAVRDPNRGEGVHKGTFARFPTLQQGREAQRQLWLSKYGDMPLDQAIDKWTGASINPNKSEITNYKNSLFAAVGAPSVSGSAIASSSTAVADGRSAMAFQPPVIMNSPQTINNVSNGGGGGLAAASSVFDTEFGKLLIERSVG